jgi:predicted glycoside hydrolase/deacetylase ChbG (UPF0249 family)
VSAGHAFWARLCGRRLLAALIACALIVLAGCSSFLSGTTEGGSMKKASQHNSAGAVQLIVNADDAGGHVLFTDASIEALRSGRISSTTVLMPAPDADRAVSILKAHPEYAVGVHLTLTGDWPPLLPRQKVRSLYNENGTMWATEEEVGVHVKPEEAVMEWEAQIQKALASGINVTHLDSHMGCYFISRELFRGALGLAVKYRLPMIAPYIPSFVTPEEKPLFPIASYEGVYDLGGAEENLANRTQAYRTLFERFGPGIHYVFSHHGRPVEDPSEFDDLPIRIDDFDFWTGDGAADLLAERGFTIISPARVTELFRSALGPPR